MRAVLDALTLLYISSIFAEASLIPSSISDVASDIKDHAWRRPQKKRPVERLEEGAYPKYFHEPDGNRALHHYDSRYHHEVLGFGDRTVTQVHLIRSFTEYFRKNNMETWLAHGTLLGWWWNAKMLPWDWDIDTQVSIGTMLFMAGNHNATKYSYTSATDTEFDPSTSKQQPISRKYHLDVNPAVYTRHRSEGDNIIDARWIDTANGLYIDITAVAETHPKESPGVWSCKNSHRYRTRDLWPMRESTFEDVVVKIPYAYSRVLSEEYGAKALVLDEFQGHRWSSLDKVWVKKTPKEIEHEKHDRKYTRRKKLEQTAEKLAAANEAEAARMFNEDQDDRERARQGREGRSKELGGASAPAAEPERGDRQMEKRGIMQEGFRWRTPLDSKPTRPKRVEDAS